MNKKNGLFQKVANDKLCKAINIHLEKFFHSSYDAFMNNFVHFPSKWTLQVGGKIWMESNQ
jgi:hypothetical protein